jgi:hypothetical protein
VTRRPYNACEALALSYEDNTISNNINISTQLRRMNNKSKRVYKISETYALARVPNSCQKFIRQRSKSGRYFYFKFSCIVSNHVILFNFVNFCSLFHVVGHSSWSNRYRLQLRIKWRTIISASSLILSHVSRKDVLSGSLILSNVLSGKYSVSV